MCLPECCFYVISCFFSFPSIFPFTNENFHSCWIRLSNRLFSHKKHRIFFNQKKIQELRLNWTDMPIDDKVSADRQSFVFWKKKYFFSLSNPFECQKINSNCFWKFSRRLRNLQTKREKWSDGVIPVFSGSFFIAHSLEYIITACRCSLRIHSRAKRYRFFGNFHLERELNNRILSFAESPAVSNSPANYSIPCSHSLSYCERRTLHAIALSLPSRPSFTFHTFAEFLFWLCGGIFHLQIYIEHSNEYFVFFWQLEVGHSDSSM